MMKKALRTSVFFLPLLLLGGCSGDEEDRPEVIRPVKSIKLGTYEGGVQRRFPARIYASKRAEMSFRVPGKVTTLPVKEGDIVKEGDVLASLDPTDYQITVNDAQAKFERAEADYKRAKKLVKDGFISRTDFDKLESNYKSARAALDKAQQDLSYTTLKAPFDGVVAKRYVENFEEVRRKQEVFSMQSTEMIDVKFDIPETLVLKIREKRREEMLDDRPEDPFVFVSFPGTEKSYPLRFKETATRADPRTRTFEVTFTMETPDEINILPGMSAEIEVDISQVLGRKEDVIYVPVTAVFADPEGKDISLVWVLDEQTRQVEQREVTLGELTGSDVEITSGLKGDERIVTAGVHHLKPGQQVLLMEGMFGK